MGIQAIGKKSLFRKALRNRIRFSESLCQGNREFGFGAQNGKGGEVGFHTSHRGAVMAIKRPTKSKSAPSHKPVATPPLRHVDVRPPQQMVPDEVYVGWLCKNRSCGRAIAIASPAPSGKALADFDDHVIAIKCPHCGDEELYRWSGRSEQKYAPKHLGAAPENK